MPDENDNFVLSDIPPAVVLQDALAAYLGGFEQAEEAARVAHRALTVTYRRVVVDAEEAARDEDELRQFRLTVAPAGPVTVPDAWLLAAAIDAYNDGREALADFDGDVLEFLSDGIAAVIPLIRAEQAVELERLRVQVAGYENAIAWDTTCMRHAELLDECRRQEERAERAEREVARLRAAEAAEPPARENRSAESHGEPRTRPTPPPDTRPDPNGAPQPAQPRAP